MLRAHFTAQSKSSERDWDALLTLRRAKDAFPAKSKLPTKAHAKLRAWSPLRQNYFKLGGWHLEISLSPYRTAAHKSRKDAKEVVFCPGPRGFVRGAGVGRARPGNP